MEEKIIVRVYDVGFGDCIYVGIPDGERFFNMLIDCGSKSASDSGQKPKDAVDHLISKLPKEADGKPHLDLLVVTHPHFDHVNGFEEKRFGKFAIDRIWLPVFMDPQHDQAEGAHKMEETANAVAKSLLARAGLNLSMEVQALLMRGVSNKTAFENLRTNYAEYNKIEKLYPLYISRDMGQESKKVKKVIESYDIELNEGVATFCGFHDTGTKLRILAPEWNIDKYYLGKISDEYKSLIENNAALVQAEEDVATESSGKAEGPSRQPEEIVLPENISERDFRNLQNRLLYSALAFIEDDEHLKNNTSVVLLLEWRGRRLLFTGDAEWDGEGVQEGRKNANWDVMYKIPEVKKLLLKPLDYLKVSHHGSINGTPFLNEGFKKIIEKMVIKDKTDVVISTKWGPFTGKNPVPYWEVLENLGNLARNKQKYPRDPDDRIKGEYEPQRTDQEPDNPEESARFVEVKIEAVQ